MNKIILSFFIAASLSFSTNASAQQTEQTFLSKIPSLPQNICTANDAIIMKWNDKILALKNEMNVLLGDEKQRKEQAQANAQSRTDMFEPGNAERIQKLGEEIQSVETEINAIFTTIVSSFTEKQSNVELKYSTLFDQLNQQKRNTKSQGKNAAAIDSKIREAKNKKCAEMSVIRSNYLSEYKKELNKLIELGIKGNELSDKMTNMAYEGYTFHTKYGIWLGVLIGYTDELSHLYDDMPIYETGKE